MRIAVDMTSTSAVIVRKDLAKINTTILKASAIPVLIRKVRLKMNNNIPCREHLLGWFECYKTLNPAFSPIAEELDREELWELYKNINSDIENYLSPEDDIEMARRKVG